MSQFQVAEMDNRVVQSTSKPLEKGPPSPHELLEGKVLVCTEAEMTYPTAFHSLWPNKRYFRAYFARTSYEYVGRSACFKKRRYEGVIF